MNERFFITPAYQVFGFKREIAVIQLVWFAAAESPQVMRFFCCGKTNSGTARKRQSGDSERKGNPVMNGTSLDSVILGRHTEVFVRVQRLLVKALADVDPKDVLLAFERTDLVDRLITIIRTTVIATIRETAVVDVTASPRQEKRLPSNRPGRSIANDDPTSARSVGLRLREARINSPRFQGMDVSTVLSILNLERPDRLPIPVPIPTYYAWENGTRHFAYSTSEMERIVFFAQAYDVDLMWLIYGKGERRPYQEGAGS
jgi:hypothetical protein